MTADEQTGFEVQIEVDATPEQVWEAISTTHGISSWFLPAEVVDRHITFHHLPGETSAAEITDLDAPRRLRFIEDDGAQATEFLIEARAGGTCVMRVVGFGFGGKGAEDGWTAALFNLKLYLEHFTGQHSFQVLAGQIVPGPQSRAWDALQAAVGVDDPAVGARVTATAEGAAPLKGVVEGRLERMITMRLDEPAPGIGFVGIGGPDEETVYAVLRTYFFGPGAEELAARDEPAWRALVAERVGVAD
jgi:uncharacterized protein YndB with AHSA1/START domain